MSTRINDNADNSNTTQSIENLRELIDQMRELHEYFNEDSQDVFDDGLSLSLESIVVSEIVEDEEKSSEKSIDQSMDDFEVASAVSSLVQRIEWPITVDEEILKDTLELPKEYQLSKKTLTRMVQLLFAHEEVAFRIKRVGNHIEGVETLILEQDFIKMNLKRLQDYVEEGLNRKTKFDNIIDLLRNKTKPRTKLLFLFPKENLWQLFDFLEEHYEAEDRLSRLKERKQIFRDKIKCFLKPLIKIIQLMLEERAKEEEAIKAELEKAEMAKRKTGRATRMSVSGRPTNTSRATKLGDTNRETKMNETSRETKLGDTSRETKLGDTSRATKLEDTNRATKIGDITPASISRDSTTIVDTQLIDESVTDAREEVIVIDEKCYIINKEFWEKVLERLKVVLEECEEVDEQDNIEFKEYMINRKENKNVKKREYLLEMLYEMEVESERDHCDFFKPDEECVINLSDTIETIKKLNEYDLLYSRPVIIHLTVEKSIDEDADDDNENGDKEEEEEEEEPVVFPREVIWRLAKLFREYHLDELDPPKCFLDQEVRRRKQAERAIVLKFEGEERERRERLEREIRYELENSLYEPVEY